MYFDSALDASNPIQSIIKEMKQKQKTNEFVESTNRLNCSEKSPIKASIWSKHFEKAQSVSQIDTDLWSVEMKLYLSEPLLPMDSNPIMYWLNSNFKLLNPIAIKYLSVVATSVPSERLFSKTGLIMSKLRSNLAPERFDKIVFIASNNWKPTDL